MTCKVPCKVKKTTTKQTYPLVLCFSEQGLLLRNKALNEYTN